MAVVTNPLMSLGASGSIAGAITFSTWKGRPYVRQLVTPSNPQSEGQTANRAMMSFLSKTWALNTGMQVNWAALAKQMVVSTFNAFVSYNQKRWTQAGSPYQDPTATPGGTSPTLATPTCTGGVGQISISQVVTTVANGWGIIWQISATGVAPPDPKTGTTLVSDLTGVVNGGTITPILTNLDPGTYRVTYTSFTTTGHPGTAAHVDSIVVT